MLQNFKNHTKQGNVGLGYAIAYYTSKEYSVSIPLNDSQKYDLIFDNGKLNKVQIKTTRAKNTKNKFIVQLKTVSGRKILGFHPEEFDYLFVLTDAGDLYEIPSSYLVKYKSAILLTDALNCYKITL